MWYDKALSEYYYSVALANLPTIFFLCNFLHTVFLLCLTQSRKEEKSFTKLQFINEQSLTNEYQHFIFRIDLICIITKQKNYYFSTLIIETERERRYNCLTIHKIIIRYEFAYITNANLQLILKFTNFHGYWSSNNICREAEKKNDFCISWMYASCVRKYFISKALYSTVLSL